jgi:hypothetical protein
MVADVKIKANTIQVVNYIKKLQRNIPKDIIKGLARAASYAEDDIDQRTRNKGLDFTNKKFKKYSEVYKQSDIFKKKQNKFVDLTLHGHMFNSLTWNIKGKTATLFFRRKTEQIKAWIHDTGIGKMPPRRFFSISKQQENTIRDIFYKSIRTR